MSKLTLLIESEELLYRMAFAVETTRYKIRNNRNGVEKVIRKGVDKKTAQSLITPSKASVYELISYKEVEDVSHAIRLLKYKLEVLKNMGEVKLFLNPPDKSNFRYAVAKTGTPSKGVGYKAGRADKPEHYQACRDYLMKYYNPIECYGLEADDGLSMNHNDGTVICSIDKDLNMVAGKHLNWITMRRYMVPEGFGVLSYDKKKYKASGLGMCQFYLQMLLGDNTDNIPGVPGYGHAKSYKALCGCITEQQAAEIVKDIYVNSFGGEIGMDRLYEVADLLYMVRQRGVTGRDYIHKALGWSGKDKWEV